MPFAPECFWAFQGKATFWAIFDKFLLVPVCTFLENAGFGWSCKNCHNLAIRALLEPVFCPIIFSSLCPISGYKLEDNDICARVLLAFWSEGYFLGDFWKISLGLPFALFQKMRVLGDLLKIAITWLFGHFWSRLLRLNLFQSFCFNCILITV